jgi:hypothetical protein
MMNANILFKGLLWIPIIFLLNTGCTPIAVTEVGINATPTLQLATLQPSVTGTSTKEPSPIITLTPLPTLTTEEQDIYVRELLKTNADCQLPCWWRITPGKTSWNDTEDFLRYLGATIGQTELESGVILHWAMLQDNLSYIDQGFLEREVHAGKVDTIFVGGNHSGTQNQSNFEAMWESYSPRQIMTKYGAPSRVLLSAPGGTGLGDTGNNGYIMWIFYDYSGFMIRYDGIVADLPVYHFCPELKKGADDIYRIDITLQYPDHPLSLEWDDAILSTQPSRAKSIQDAAGISIDEFYRLFTQNDEPACFDTPHDIWVVK